MEILLPVLIIGLIALVAGIALTLFSRFMSTESNEKLNKILEVLPGANCGGCGYPGCEGYARAVAKGNIPYNLCAPGGVEAAKQLTDILGIASDISDEPKTAVVRCSGNYEEAPDKMIYRGVPTCTAASMYFGGTRVCTYGCMGFGDCAKVCVFKAISFSHGVAIVDSEKCVGCGRCAVACPKELITVVPKDFPSVVSCKNHDRGMNTRNVCEKGCIGCGICAKVCSDGAIVMQDNLPVIDFTKCTQCRKCAKACPAKIIIHKKK